MSIRLILRLSLGLVSLYWIGMDLLIYLDGPVSSTISSKFGDDNMGGILFPSILLCHTNAWPNLNLPCGQNASTLTTFLTSCLQQRPDLTFGQLMTDITINYEDMVTKIEAVKGVTTDHVFYPKWGSCLSVTNDPPLVNMSEAKNPYYQMRLRLKNELNTDLFVAFHHNQDVMDLSDGYPMFNIESGNKYVMSLEKRVRKSLATKRNPCSQIPYKTCLMQEVTLDLIENKACRYARIRVM